MWTRAVLLAAGIAQVAPAAAPVSYTAPIVAPLKLADGASGGRVTLIDAPGGILLKVDAMGLAPGWHGVHFHEKADCSDAAFKMAGSHIHTVTPVVHGLLNPQANDRGDLPNLYAGADGTAHAEMFSPLVALRDGTPRPNLMDADGSAVIIHAHPDDLTTQPIGGAGDRVACALVK